MRDQKRASGAPFLASRDTDSCHLTANISKTASRRVTGLDISCSTELVWHGRAVDPCRSVL